MANKIEFSATLDGTGFKAGLNDLQRTSDAASARMSRSMDLLGGPRGAANVMGRSRKEFIAMMGAGGGETMPGMGGAGGAFGRFGKYGVAQTMFISAARDTFTGLASGQNPVTVFLQQAPQVAQGFVMMGKEALKSLVPFLKWAGGIGAAVLVGWLLIRRLIGIREEQKNFANLTDTSNRAIADQVKLLREAADANRQQVDWLRRHSTAQHSLADAATAALEALRKQHDFEKQLASARGDTPAQMAQMEIEQARQQLEATKKARDAALDEHTRLLKEQQAAQAAAVSSTSPFGAGGGLAAIRARLPTAQKVVQAILDAMQKGVMEIDPEASRIGAMAGGAVPARRLRAATSADIFEVTVEGKTYKRSLAEARDALTDLTGQEITIVNTQKDLDTALKGATKAVESSKDNFEKLNKQVGALESDLKLKEEFLPAIAGAKKPSGGVDLPKDSLLAVGNFLGSSRNLVHTMEARKLDLLSRIEANTRGLRTGLSGQNAVYPTP